MGATDAESVMREQSCRLHLALKARPKTKPDTGDWAVRDGPFMLKALMSAIERVERHLSRGVAIDEAVQLEKRAFVDQHDGARRFLEHALEQYYAYHEARQEQLGRLRFVESWMKIQEKPNATLALWGTVYDGPGGVREVRRFRTTPARKQITAWAYIAARVAARRLVREPVQRIWVTEIGLHDGIESHVLKGITPEEADNLYERHGREAALAVVEGGSYRPGRDCSSCRATSVCDALIALPGFLQSKGRGPWTRSLSASDLELHDQCPSRWYMEHEAHLPRDEEGSEFQRRGRAVHRWLVAAHARGQACTAEDLPAPERGMPLVGADVLDPRDYELAHSFLRSHAAVCPHLAEGIGHFVSERTLYAFDSAADVVIATKADATWLQGDRLVIREVKTVQALPEADRDAIFSWFLAVSWGLVALDAGVARHFGATRGEVQLELLSPHGAVVHTYSTDDPELMAIARGRIRRLGRRWLADTTWSPQPSAGCTQCSVRRWCVSRDDWAHRPTGAAASLPAAPVFA
ncbi:PD-(D/E)XK nuclease family protein [Plantactinospora solaniradicis]|uniref:PD-(D/E)XK nuclease family protein n=1 Tax=Plantactinospora solaniradicis TaxID=1723736 RepID=A0ABW1KKP5_9ACTN